PDVVERVRVFLYFDAQPPLGQRRRHQRADVDAHDPPGPRPCIAQWTLLRTRQSRSQRRLIEVGQGLFGHRVVELAAGLRDLADFRLHHLDTEALLQVRDERSGRTAGVDDPAPRLPLLVQLDGPFEDPARTWA